MFGAWFLANIYLIENRLGANLFGHVVTIRILGFPLYNGMKKSDVVCFYLHTYAPLFFQNIHKTLKYWNILEISCEKRGVQESNDFTQLCSKFVKK